MKKELPTKVLLSEKNDERLTALSKSNRYGISLARLANLAIEKGLPLLVTEVAKPITQTK